jgi:hypothetical protein
MPFHKEWFLISSFFGGSKTWKEHNDFPVAAGEQVVRNSSRLVRV